jgi:hypothetical protein
MKFVVDGDDDVTIATGDFIIIAFTHSDYVKVYVAYGVFARHVVGYGSS